MSKAPPPNSPGPKSRRGYVLIPAGLLASALTGGGAGWATGRDAAPPAVVSAAAAPQVCEDFGAAVRTLQSEVAGLKQREHDREEREKTLAEFERRLRDLQTGPGPLKK